MSRVLVYLALGSNIGDRRAQIFRSVRLLGAHESSGEIFSSNIFCTAPVSPLPQPDFLNAVVAFSTSLAPQELFQLTSHIEKKLGKFPKPKIHPRTIDLDILFYGREQISSDLLQIPHPRWSERLFVVEPLIQLTPSVHVRTSDGGTLNYDLQAIRQTLTQTKPTELRGEIACPLKQSPLRISA